MRFTDEHLQLRRTVREHVEKEINPHYEAWEKAGGFPAHEVFKKLGKLGLLGVNKPEAYGGMGLDYSYQMVVSEEHIQALKRANVDFVDITKRVGPDGSTPVQS